MFATMPALIDMAVSPEEAKKEIANYAMPASAETTVARYPYGLCISLDEESLKKVGLLDGDLPPVGAMLSFIAEAKITSASANEMETGDGATKTCRRVELQIQKMAIPGAADPVKADKAIRKRWYPGQRDSDGDEDGD